MSLSLSGPGGGWCAKNAHQSCIRIAKDSDEYKHLLTAFHVGNIELTIKTVESQDTAIAPPVGDDADPMDILILIYRWIWDSGSGVVWLHCPLLRILNRVYRRL